MKKSYLKPELSDELMEVEECILQGSIEEGETGETGIGEGELDIRAITNPANFNFFE
jgi:hypothetical protein